MNPNSIGRVLVDGGAGYLGTVLVGKLLERGYAVKIFDNLLHGEESLSAFRRHPNLTVVRGELRNIDSVFKVVRGMDAVIHLAAIVGDQACDLEPAVTVQVNAVASRVLFEASRFHRVKRFVFASTCSVYGQGTRTLDEQSALQPVSLYARSKIEAEKSILEISDSVLSPCILRASTLFGLSPRMRFDLVINALTARAVTERQFTIFGGTQWRPFLHVADAAEAYIRCLEAEKRDIWGQIYNLGDSRLNYQIKQIGEIVCNLVPGARMSLEKQDIDQRDYRVSFDRIQDKLGFKAVRTVEDGVGEIREAMMAGRLLDYRDKKYSNYLKGFDDYYSALLKYDAIDKI